MSASGAFGAGIAALLLAAAPPADDQTLTIAAARSLPPEALARRVLGAAGAVFVEVERPEVANPAPMGPPGLQGLTFATAPRWTMYAGICEADVARVSFRPVSAEAGGADPPVRVDRLSTERRFRIAGDPAAGGMRSAMDENEQRQLCAGAGPVLAPEGASTRFFTVHSMRGDGHDASFAARAVNEAIRAVRGRRVGAYCADGRECAAARALVEAFDATQLTSVTVDDCSPGVGELCVWASARLPGGTRYGWTERVLEIRTDGPWTDEKAPPTILGVLAYQLRSES